MENQAIAWKGDETYKVIRGNSREIAAGDILISDEENANRWWEYSWNSCTPGIIRCIWAEMNVELDGPPNPIMIEWPVLIETIRTANFIPKDQILEIKKKKNSYWYKSPDEGQKTNIRNPELYAILLLKKSSPSHRTEYYPSTVYSSTESPYFTLTHNIYMCINHFDCAFQMSLWRWITKSREVKNCLKNEIMACLYANIL